MNILVLGGTGAMGNSLIPILSNKGHNITVTSRRYHENCNSITYIKGNAHEESFIKELLKVRWDVIVDFMVYNVAEFKERVNLLLKSTGQYVFLSSARVYDLSNKKIDEKAKRLLDTSKDEQFLATNDYSLRKARTEDVLFSSGYKNYTIIRPYITFDEMRLQLGAMEKDRWLKRAFDNKSIVLDKRFLSKITTLSYGGDVARAISSVIGNTNCLNEIYNVCTEQTITWQEVLDIYLERLKIKTGKEPKVIMTNDNNELMYQKCFYAYVYDRFHDRLFSNKKIIAIDNSLSFNDTKLKLKECIDAFLVEPHFSKISVFSIAEDDRIAGEYTKLNEFMSITDKAKYLFFRFMPREIIKMTRK